jgi:epoxyqueuosine reductase
MADFGDLDPHVPLSIHLFDLPTEISPSELIDLQKTLSTSELNFTPARQFIAFKLREILGEALGVSPKAVEFEIKNKGKPVLSPRQEPLKAEFKTDLKTGFNIGFNLSHSKNRVLIGVNLNGEIGVDIEKKRPVDALKIAKRFFHASEYEQLLTLKIESTKSTKSTKSTETHQKPEGSLREKFEEKLEEKLESLFFKLWTEKEALIKCEGKTLGSFLHISTKDYAKANHIQIHSWNNGEYFYAVAIKSIASTLPLSDFSSATLEKICLSLQGRDESSSSSIHQKLKQFGNDLGFDEIGVSDIDLTRASEKFKLWLEKQYHGTMSFMEKHGEKRWRPELLIPGTIRAISVRQNYLTPDPKFTETLDHPTQAYISRYAQNDDYHSLIRKKLEKLAQRIQAEIGKHQYRVFTDSAPVLEKPLAEKAGLGWTGKHSTLIHSKSGSYFFLGVIYTDMPLPITHPEFNGPDALPIKSHCGTCTTCIKVCPTQAILEPYVLDARKCISYLTIEHKGPIPVEFRKAIGNRIYGCDDCQIFCPWNKFAKASSEIRFHANSQRDFLSPDLLELFNWSEKEFLKKTEGSPIRRIGYEKWISNIAIALGNSQHTENAKPALQAKLALYSHSEVIRESIEWALGELQAKST